ncbi:hypothetical protein CBR_g11150 [Chara braunii]|uniref:Uncharacterized protein n=1 Tax=Chara braunii TaxID=69332 RepID=A0A388KQE2_CHABU|nr:hypothetical protein CBR_g11150 [Chara braunii]|eukprot:GBG72218.1 hypothetical protein CBR_g11150 [Chara braunii]
MDKVYNKFIRDEESEKKRKEQEEIEKKKKEEDEKRNEWKKEREQLEAEMASRLNKRFEEFGLKKKEQHIEVRQFDEIARLKRENEELLRRINGNGNNCGDEVIRLRRESDELRRKMNGEGSSCGNEGVVARLQEEIYDLRKAIGSKQLDNDEIFALKQEIGELKQSAYMKTNFEQEIAGSRKKIDVLRKQNEKAMDETRLWKDEALRPGNKRGSVVVNTPGLPNRGTPKPRWTDNMKDNERWKEEYKKLQSLHRIANVEAELLKEKRVQAESKRMEAEKQVKELEEKMSRLNLAGDGERAKEGGTNLKEKLEASTIGSARRGHKVTPGRSVTVGDKATTLADDVNNRFLFVEEQKKNLRNLKKSGLEPMCKEAGIRTGKVEQMVCELAEFRAEQAFGLMRAKDGTTKGKQPIYDVDDDSEQKESNSQEEGDARSVEL